MIFYSLNTSVNLQFTGLDLGIFNALNFLSPTTPDYKSGVAKNPKVR